MHLWDYGINGQGIGKLLLFYAEKKIRLCYEPSYTSYYQTALCSHILLNIVLEKNTYLLSFWEFRIYDRGPQIWCVKGERGFLTATPGSMIKEI